MTATALAATGTSLPYRNGRSSLMAGWWAESGEGFERVLPKYQLLLAAVRRERRTG